MTDDTTSVKETGNDDSLAVERSETAPVEGVTFSSHEVNGIRMRVAEAGEGPLVLFAHGWPESWYRGTTSFRHWPKSATTRWHPTPPDKSRRVKEHRDPPRAIIAEQATG